MSAVETARAAFRAIDAHLKQCTVCDNSRRWADMCEPGKILYDNMYAASKMAAKEQRNET